MFTTSYIVDVGTQQAANAAMCNRLGRVVVSTPLITQNAAAFMEIMAALSILIIDAAHNAYSQTIEFTCLCPHFDKVPAGMTIPHYDINVKHSEDPEQAPGTLQCEAVLTPRDIKEA